ncbi:MAG: ferredoxin [Pseudomonadota bacterium]
MAEINDKLPENTEGRFYVDEQCIDCCLCIETAPKNFAHVEESGYAYLCRQPQNEEEEECCKEAMESCPSNAIGDDGE